MILFESFLSPIPITFTVLVVGYLVGRIRIFGISLDLVGVLAVAVVFGYIITSNDFLRNATDIIALKSNMQLFSSLGTALFVSVIGITTGYSLNLRTTKNIKAILIGALMVTSAFALMNLFILSDKDISCSKLLGALCGALTTTPGLSAVNELKDVIAEEATLGYGCTYLFGVIATVLCVQIITRKSDVVVEKEIQNVYVSRFALGGLLQIGIAVVLGQLVGGIRLGVFSLGNSGGILCVGILVGAIIKRLYPQRSVSAESIEFYRNFGLILFFVGNGIPAGMSFCNNFDLKTIIYGVLMTVVPIVVGIILSKLPQGLSLSKRIPVTLALYFSIVLRNFSANSSLSRHSPSVMMVMSAFSYPCSIREIASISGASKSVLPPKNCSAARMTSSEV